jgi:LmbE family N-acetylglucosaminyl deacetylase
MNVNRKILTICAHPDDELLGLGGTIHHRVKKNNCIAEVLILGEGIKSRNLDSKYIIDIDQHRSNSKRACEIIGYQKVHFLSFPDNAFDTVPFLDIVNKIEIFIQTIKPDDIFTHHEYDLNIDHQLTSRAVATATRPLPNEKNVNIYHFETFSSTEWSFSKKEQSFCPNVFFQLDQDDITAKKKGMTEYSSEIRDWPHPRSLKNLEVVANKWGATVGVDYAEAFQLIKSVIS